MLASLSIKNYALIDELKVSFEGGFTAITGETGAGKSILLGGLSLVLGKRADLSSLREKSKKCIIEAEFEVAAYGLDSFFEENDLDYESRTIVRREIQPSGKSRAFINDSPVTLDILTQLGDALIDVHSQHQTLRLADNDFQLKLIDALADNSGLLEQYSEKFTDFNTTADTLEKLQATQREALKEHDYNSFLSEELEAAQLKEGMQEELEARYEQLNNVETIRELLAESDSALNDEQVGAVNILGTLKRLSDRLSGFGSQYQELNQRIQSVFIEVDDIANEVQAFQESAEADPKALEEISARLQQLYDLQKKHGVTTVSELIEIETQLSDKLFETGNLDAQIQKHQERLSTLEKTLNELSKQLSDRRKKVVPELKKQLQASLASLGMPSASFEITLGISKSFRTNGRDDLKFLFSANKGTDFGELKKVASGGELSRIMLTIKSILARYEQLPTMMFDEIDTGVSGEISNKMGDIMKAMSHTMQVFSITHLPQVASKGDHHFKVYKMEEGETTRTRMKKLNSEERVVELAGMLGGKELSDSALAHAKQLLN